MTPFFSCRTGVQKETPTFEIIADTTKDRFREIEFCALTAEMLNLKQISNGVENFELRVWTFKTGDKSKLYILRRLDENWIGCNYTYSENAKLFIDSLRVNCQEVEGQKGMQLKSFLTQDSIKYLPSQASIPGFKDTFSDGAIYFVEISTQTFYKVFGFRNPTEFDDHFNRSFVSLLDFISSHSNIYQFN